jgi:hypothetical protein
MGTRGLGKGVKAKFCVLYLGGALQDIRFSLL